MLLAPLNAPALYPEAVLYSPNAVLRCAVAQVQIPPAIESSPEAILLLPATTDDAQLPPAVLAQPTANPIRDDAVFDAPPPIAEAHPEEVLD